MTARVSIATGARLLGCRRHALGEVGSTQDELGRLAAEGAPEGTVVTAEHQTGGRGRRGHSWWDTPGENLLVSILLRPPIPIAQAPQLSLIAAVAVVDALDEALVIAAGIRWPNDILVDGRKLAGILSEAAASGAGRLQHVLVGIGLNVNQTAFPAAVAGRATSLRLLTGRPQARDRLLDHLLGAFDRRYAEFLSGGFAAVRGDWTHRSVTIGQRLRTADGFEGEALEVDEEGALVLRAADGRLIRLTSGEIAGAPSA